MGDFLLTLNDGNKKSYEEAMIALNGLKTNAADYEKPDLEKRKATLQETLKCMSKIGLEVDELDKLKIIHVTGTKGKGSTSAFCDSILRSHGFKTGFYSSPHLIEFCERIRINGKPLSKEKFAHYFWHCYSLFDQSKKENNDLMPSFFMFLTIMGFYVFLQEKVDVAIIEVGLGGALDCTNITKHPVVCGVSSLALDHVEVLGSTIEEIAWEKAGIFKKGVPAITVDQTDKAMSVLKNRAQQLEAPLYLALDQDFSNVSLGIHGLMQPRNASLAVNLCNFWLKDHMKGLNGRLQEHEEVSGSSPELQILCKEVSLTPAVINGLKSCKWPGRCQKVVHEGITYYLDGAHTNESFDVCAKWFMAESEREKSEIPGQETRKILWFNMYSGRDPKLLLKRLAVCDFDCAIFSPNTRFNSDENSSKYVNRVLTREAELKQCSINRDAWMSVLQSNETTSHPPSQPVDGNVPGEFYPDARMPTYIFPSIEATLAWLKKSCPLLRQVLCAGSLALVGGVLSFVDPDACN